MTNNQQFYNIAAIRELLLSAFWPAELRRFCQDRPVFRPVVAKFGPGQGLEGMVDQVIDYCESHVLFDELLAEIKLVNPRQYAAHYRDHLWLSSGRPPEISSRVHRKPSRSNWLEKGIVTATILALFVAALALARDFFDWKWPLTPGPMLTTAPEPTQVTKDKLTPTPTEIVIPTEAVFPTTAVPQPTRYVTVSLPSTDDSCGRIALSSVFDEWPYPGQRLKGIPFHFDEHGSFIQTQFEWPGWQGACNGVLPPTVTIPVNVSGARKVYILMNLSYACDYAAPKDSKVGEVILNFDEGPRITRELYVGDNIREWNIETSICDKVVDEIHATNVYAQVWRNRRREDNELCVIDMFVLDIPSEYTSRVLEEMVVKDTSVNEPGSVNPGILIFGVTVLAQ